MAMTEEQKRKFEQLSRSGRLGHWKPVSKPKPEEKLVSKPIGSDEWRKRKVHIEPPAPKPKPTEKQPRYVPYKKPPEKKKRLIEPPELLHRPTTRPVPPGIQDKIAPRKVTGEERRYYEEQLKKQGVPEGEYKGKPIYVRPTGRGVEIIIGDPRKKVKEKPQFPEAKRGFITLKSGKRVKVQKEKSWEKIEGWLKSGKSRYRRLREKRDPTFIEEVLGLKFTQYAASRPLGQADIERIAKGKIFTADLLRLGVSSKKEAKKLAKDLLSGRKRWSDISVTIYAPIEVPSTLAGKFSNHRTKNNQKTPKNS